MGVVARARITREKQIWSFQRSPKTGTRRLVYCLAGREADLPAQEAQASPDARVPRPHAHSERPPDHQASSPQGSQAADAVTPGERRRRGRLSRSGDFERVYREGRSHANRFLVLYAFPRRDSDDDREEVRLGISVSRKVGGAVERNAVKRGLREAFWSFDERLPRGHDFVLVARPDAAGLVEREGPGAVVTALEGLISEAGPRGGTV